MARAAYCMCLAVFNSRKVITMQKRETLSLKKKKPPPASGPVGANKGLLDGRAVGKAALSADGSGNGIKIVDPPPAVKGQNNLKLHRGKSRSRGLGKASSSPPSTTDGRQVWLHVAADGTESWFDEQPCPSIPVLRVWISGDTEWTVIYYRGAISERIYPAGRGWQRLYEGEPPTFMKINPRMMDIIFWRERS
jgi:hypothetical protein